MNKNKVAHRLLQIAKELTAYVGEKAAVFTNSGLLQVAVGEDYYMIEPDEAAKVGKRMLSVVQSADKDLKRNFSILPISSQRPKASISTSSERGKIRISAGAVYMVDDSQREEVEDYFKSNGYYVR